MTSNQPNTFSLDVFEGPLALLLQLLQKNEIEIWDISIQKILRQYLGLETSLHSMENGAEFIGTTALLLLMKSKKLLPKHELADEELDLYDTNFEIIYQLLDYCRFKEAGKILIAKENEQAAFHSRGLCQKAEEVKKKSGIENVSLSELALLFQQVLQKSKIKTGFIEEEEWKVSERIQALRQLFAKEHKTLEFASLFCSEKSRSELIATFLALLEMIKGGELYVRKDSYQKLLISLGTSYD